MHSVSRSIPHEPNYQIKMMQGSVTSGEFMSESLSCEKWSNACKKQYVEEAKSYTQPGSVAEKKAFFDAYYKKIAAQKAAAAALLEQEKAAAAAAAAANAHEVTSKVVDLAIDSNMLDANSKNFEDHVSVCASQTERSLLKLKLKGDEEVAQPRIMKKPAVSPWVASIHHRKDNISTPRAKNVITKDYNDKTRLSPMPLKVLMNSSFVQESCRKAQNTKPTSSLCSTPKRSVTPVKTPAKAFAYGVSKPHLATLSASRSSKSLTAYKSKFESPTISSPFALRTEDRAARRKQKLEEKFNEKQAQVVQQKAQFKDKAESEIRKMRESLCFKALPLPEFYKGRETPEKILEANPKWFTPRRTTPSSTNSVKKMSSR